MRIEGFEYRRLEIAGAVYEVAVGGEGPAVALLHGYPQTHICWRAVAPDLARSHTVVAPDIRGYGATEAPPGGPLGDGYSKREMAADVVSILDALGIGQAAMVGHDRGGRVAYRMALDHPDRVERLAVLNVVPTVEQFERMSPENALSYWPWLFLAQPAPFPERLIAAAPDHYVNSLIDAWSALPERIGPEARAAYVEALSDPRAIASTCADYRAAFHLDRRHDAADRRAGRRIGCPMLVAWGALDEGFAAGGEGPADVWRRWAERVEGLPLAAGHFIPEEAPDELASALGRFLTRAGHPSHPGENG
jgi:haloacetate dehalogenase